MAKKDRAGIRKRREHFKRLHVPELGYYLIITDTKGTERCYFEGMLDNMPNSMKNKIVIKVVETKTVNLVEKCYELAGYDPQYRIPWIVFDRDQVNNFDKIIQDAHSKHIHVGWSNPCFEIWMYAYFKEMPAIFDSWNCCSRFATKFENITKEHYSKTDVHLYKRLIEYGDEDYAIQLAKQKFSQHLQNGYILPSEMVPCSTVYQLVEEINMKRKNNVNEKLS